MRDIPPYAIHGELTDDGQRIVLLAAGEEHWVRHAAKLLQTLTPLIKPTTPPGGLQLPATWAAVAQLANVFGEAWRPGPALSAWIAGETALRLGETPAGLSVKIPEGLTPYPWQTTGARMIARLGKALVFDEAGSGKTITTILGLLERAASGIEVYPAVVVCPASVVDPWVEAWRTWAPNVATIAWRGTPKQRRALAGTAEVYVTSYDTARSDVNGATSALLGLAPSSVILDEHHFVKNMHAARSVAARKLARCASTVAALSGTPITHSPADLWPALDALEHDAWPSSRRWKDRYCLSLPGDYGEQIVGLRPDTEPEFRVALLGQHRRVAKADVLSQLPPKVYSTRVVQLPPAWRKVYDQMEQQMLAELPSKGEDGRELSVMGVLAQMTRLSQLASAAADIEVSKEIDENGEERERVAVWLIAPSWKADALLEILAERPGQPVVAFAPSRQLMRLAGELAAKAGHEVGYIVGGQTMRERTETIEAFQAGKLDLLCATTGAGGTGLTLTAASTCVFLQRPWSLTEALQAEDRLHRIGAERHQSVEILDVIATDTIDSRVRAVLREKAGQLADLVQDRRVVEGLLGGSKKQKRKVA